MLSGLFDLASCLEQTDVFVERDGDLRVTTRTWRGTHEVAYQPAAFVGFSLEESGKVVLDVGGGSSTYLFTVPRFMSRDRVRADLARADEAFRSCLTPPRVG